MQMQTLLLIDAGLADIDILMSGLNPGVVPFVVQPHQDALAVLEAALSTTQTFEALTVVAHGNPGEVLIGREPITKASLSNRSATWASLTGTGISSIHLFACHAGQDQAFLDGLSSITGCDVAAADKTIGHANLGAVWQLDVVATPAEGVATAPSNGLVPFTRIAREAWCHRLVTTYTVAQANLLSGGTAYNLADSASNLAAASSSLLNGSGTITLTGTSALAADLNTLDGKTTKSVDAASLTDWTGTAAAVLTALNSSGIDGLGNEAVTLTGTTTVADANSANAAISGQPVTATIREQDMASLAGLTPTGAGVGAQPYTITVSDATVAASALNTLDGKTSVAVNASSITRLTGTAEDVLSAYNRSGGITGLGNEAVALSGSTTAADANSVNGFTSGVVTATITEGNLATLTTLTGTGNAYTITVTDTTAAATDLNSVDAKTTVNLNANNVTTLTGTAADIAIAISASTITTATAVGVTISAGAVAASDLNTIDSNTSAPVNATAVTAINGLVADVKTAIASAGINTSTTYSSTLSDTSVSVANANSVDADTTGVVTATITEGNLATLTTLTGTGNAYTITVTDTTAAATDLNSVDAKTTVNLNANNVTTLTGTAADIAIAISASTITTATAVGVTIYAGAVAASDLNTIDSNTSAPVNATAVTAINGLVADVKTAIASAGINTSTTYSSTLSDTSVSVANANSVDADTTGVVTATITETAISTLGTLSGTGNAYTISVTDSSVDASALNILDGKTTVNVNAGSVGTLTGSAGDIATAISATTIDTAAAVIATVTGSTTVAQANTIDTNTTGVVTATITETTISALSGLNSSTGNAYTISVTDSSVDAAALNALDGKTTVTVNAGSVGTLTGTAAAIDTAINASTIDTGAAVLATVTGSATVAQANTIDTNTTGVVTATITETTIAALSGLNTSTGNAYTISVSDSSVDAAALNTLDGKTTVNVNAGSVGTLTGSAADIASAISATTIDTAAAVIATVTGSATVAQANTIDTNTTGVVTATITETTIAALSGLNTSTGNAYTITLSETSAAASALNTLDGKTTVALNAASVTTLTGTAADVNAAYTANTAGTITGLGNEAVTLSDTSLTATVLNTVNSNTSGVVNAASVTTLTGLLADVNTAYAANTANTISGLGDETVTITNSAGTLLAIDLTTAGNATSGTVTVTNGQTVTGTVAEVTAALVTASSKVVMGSASTATVSNAATAAEGAPIATTANITASFSSGISDTLANLANSGSISSNLSSITTDQGNVVVTIADAAAGTFQAADLSAVGNATTGAVSITNSQTVNGTADQVIAAVVTSTSKVNLNSASTLNASTYTSQDLSGVATSFTLNVTTATGAVLDSAKLATADAITIGAGSTSIDASSTDEAALAAKTTVNNSTTLTINNYVNTDLSGLSNQGTGSIVVNTTTSAVLNETYLADATSVVLGAAATGVASAIDGIGANGSRINLNSQILSVSDYTNQDLSGITTAGTLNVTTATGAILESAKLATADAITIGAGTASIDASSTDEAALAAKTTVNNSTTLTINNYVNTDLSGLNNQGTGSIVVNTTTSAVLNETYLADATSVVLGAAATGAASAIDGIGANGSRINLNSQILSVSDYTNQNLSGITTAGTLNVTTINGAVLDATKLATADSITLVGINTAPAADADTLGSRLGGTATLNITTDPITANTDLSDLGSGLTLQFGGDTTAVVTGATLTVRQDQVSGYTISGTGTVAAAGTAGADTFNASGITATTNFTSLAGADSITIAPSALGSVDVIDGGADTDSLIFSAAATVADVAFTNVSSVEILQLAAGTNSITLGVEAEQAGITTVTGNTGADTLNLLYGTAGLTFNAGGGADTLSYSADSTAQSITLSSIASNAASGSVVNNGTDSFTGLESIVGGSGTVDSITSTSAAEALIVTGANAGTIDGFSFSGVESVNLGDGNDTATINTGGSLGGSLSFGSGTSDSLSYAGYGSAVSVTLDSISGNAGTTTSAGATAISGIASGFESLTGSSNSDSLVASTAGNTLILTGANQGTVDGLSFSSFESVDLGVGNNSVRFTSGDSLSGTLAAGNGADTLDYSSYGSAVTVDLGSGTATGTGGISGFDTVLGTSAADTLTASNATVNLQGNAGVDTFNFTVAGLTSTDTVDGGDATDTLVFTTAGTITDDKFTNVTTVESVTLTGASSLTAGTEANQAGIATVTIGSGATTVNTILAGYDLTIDSANLGDGASLTLTGSASSNDFTVNNLVGSVLASGTSGSLTVSAGNATDNAIGVTTGSGAATINASGTGDTITVNADAMADNTTLDINGSATYTVSNLEANTDAAGTSGTVSLAYTDVTDNAASITTGTGATTVSGTTSGDTLTINAASLANNTALNESGAAQQVVTNLVGDISATALTGTLSVTTGDASDNGISIATGTANTTITASGTGDTITVNADAMADNTTLDINGSATYTVSNLEANTDAAGTSGTVSLAYTDVTDNAASITTGSGATTVSGTTSGDTLTINAASLANDTALTESGAAQQVVTNLVGDISATALTGTLSVTTGDASDNGISITTGTANTTITASGTGDTITVNADAMLDNKTLDINGTATYTVSNLEANTDAAGTSGKVSLAYTDVTDNAATITTGTGATTVSGTTGGDTLTINAASLANNTTLSESGAAQQVVTNLVGDLNASALTGTLTVTTGDNSTDNGISITTGTANTTITASGTGDTITLDADAMADNTTLDINGSATYTVSKLDANTDAAGTSGTVSLAYTDVTDNAATITTGTGATTVSGTTGGDTLTINAASLANNTTLSESGAAQQVVTNLVGDISATALTGTLTVTTGDNSTDNGISITTGTANTTINASGTGDTITVNADAMADNTTLDINGTATYTVSNLEANTDAAGTSGTVSLAYTDVTDNAASITTGSGATTVSGTTSGDTLTVDATNLAQNTLLTLFGAARQAVTNLIGNITGTSLNGSLDVSTGDASDNGISITTGTANTTINASGTGDTITVNADAMADNTTLDINGSATYTVSNLEANTDAAGTSGTVSLAYTDVADNAANITTGSGATTVSGTTGGDTLTINAASLANNTALTESGAAKQVVTNLVGDISASGLTGTLTVTTGDNSTDNGISITTGTANTTITASGTGDTITVNADAMADNTTLDINGSSTYTVSNLEANTDAAGTSGTVSLAYTDVTDNAAAITTGTGATTVSTTTGGDTLTVDSTLLANNTSLNLQGAAAVVVNSLSGDLNANTSLNYTDSFSSTTGWTGGNLASDSYYGSFLGQYSNGSKTNSQDVYKTFTLNSQPATISFDFLRLDSWDNENFTAYVNDTAAFTSNFTFNQGISSGSGTTNGFSWTISAKDSLTNHGFRSWEDQSATVTISLPAGYSELKLGFGSNLNSDASDESYGIDNLSITSSTTLTGALTVTTADNTIDNGINIITGAGNTTINASGTGDTITLNADAMVDNTTLDINGSATYTVSNLEANTDAAGTSGSVTLNYSDVSDNTASITTGTSNTTITSGSSGDAFSVNADAMLDNKTLDINGSAAYTANNLEANLDAAGSSGSLILTYSNVTDNAATLLTGSGNVVVNGGDAGDTATVTGLNTDNQTFNAQASTAKINITAGANNQTITGSNTASDTIDGGAGTDTLSYAGGSNVDVTISSYATQAGGSTGQGTDSFSNIETLVGATGNDILRGTTSTTDEVVTVTGANTGTIRDSASTGSFSFSSFEQLDLHGGNDTLTVNGNTSGVSLSGSVELGSGNNTLTMDGSAGSIGAVSSGTGNDTFTISAGSITGALSANDGTNQLTISGSSSSIGSYVGGTGADTVTLSNGGDVGGNISTGDGNDTVNIRSNGSLTSGNIDLGAGTADILSYDGIGSYASVDLSSISSNTGSTGNGGASFVTGTTTGFEILVGSQSTLDQLTDSSGDSAIAISGANSGTIDGLVFSQFENLNLSTGDDTVTVTGNGSGVSLTGSLDLGDGTNSLTMNSSAGSIASVTSGTGDDTFSISAGSVTGAVSAGNGSNKLTISGASSSIGSYVGGTGTDSVTLSGGDVVGNVSTSTGNDTVLISSTSSTIGGNLDLGAGTGDTLSYAGYSNAVSATLTGITSNAGSTAGGGATAIGGIASGFESLIGGSNSGDTVTDSTGDSTIVISAANSGTIDGMAFSAIENLSLSSGIDGVTVSTGGSLSGNLNLGDGTSNTLTMDSGAGAIGSVTASGGNDTFMINGGTVTGAVNLGDGANSLTINNTASTIGAYTGGSGIDTIDSKGGDILGAVNTGSAADSVTLTLGATAGAVTLGANSDSADGNDSLSLNASSITGAVTTGSGADEVTLSATSSVIGNITLGIDGDTYTASNADTLTLNASTVTGNVTTGSGADKVGVLTTSKITGNITLGSNTDSADGADTLTVTGTSSSSKSEIIGSIATGAGADSLDLTNATIGGASQTISLGTDNNSLDGNDLLSAAGTSITATITTGSGSDSLALSSGSSITGNVTLGIDGDNHAIADYPNTITDYFASSSGWTGGTIDSTNAYYGSFLGRYAAGTKTNDQDVYKSFSFNRQPATISFDLLKIDSWDGESFSAYINNTAAFTRNFSLGASIGSDSGSTNGFNWTIAAKDSNSNHGFENGWADQTATVTIALPAGYSNLQIGFGSTLDQGISDESYGIDNFSITPSILRHDDSLSLNASSITGNVITGSGADAANVVNTSTITGNVTLGSNTDSTDGADTLTVTGASSSSKSVITGSIATGAGADTLTLTNATIGGNGQTISLGSDTNGLDGNDSLSASGSAITATIATGSGSDSLSLSAGSSVTGNVNLGLDGDVYINDSSRQPITDSFSSASGWTNGTVNTSSSYYGNLLGLYANGTKTNGQDTSKSFELGGNATTISFDLARIDNWNGELFKVYVDDTVAFEQGFNTSDPSQVTGTFVGKDVSPSSSGYTTNFNSPANGGVIPWWGNATLARDLALSTGASLGLFDNNWGRGPYFAYTRYEQRPAGSARTYGYYYDPSSGNVSFTEDDPGSVLTWAQGTQTAEPVGTIKSGNTNNYSWTITTKDAKGAYAGDAAVQDQTFTVSINIPAGHANTKIGFGSTIAQGVNNQSYGIDNLSITPTIASNTDTLSLDASSITGNVITGSGADAVSVVNTSTITGNVTLGSNTDSTDGADTLTVAGASSSSKSVITGSIATGAGADTLTLTNATIGGVGEAISLGSDSNNLDGNDSLSASGTAITAAITTGSGSDSLALSANSSVTGNVSLGANADNQTIIDSFDTLNSWTGGALNNSSSYFGSFLGRYGNGTKTNGQDVSKSFTLSSQPDTISFDFIKFDTWDGESFTAYVNNTAAFTGSFRYGQSISSTSGSTNGFNWTITPKDSLGTHGFGGWENQTATITISLPQGYSNFNKLGFGSNLDEVISNESYGIDNLTITKTTSVGNDDTLSLNASTITGNVTTGNAADAVTLSNSSTITGTVNLGSSSDAQDGNDSLTLSSGSKIAGNVDFGAANDTLILSTGISSATTITGDVAFGVGNSDTLSYSGNAGPITVALDGISADAVGTATGAKASYITGNVTGFEAIVGSDYTSPTSSSVTGDVIYDNTGDSLVVLTRANTGTIDNLDFSSIENLQLRSGSDTLSFQGSSGAPGSIAGRADGGGIEGATYSNGVYAGGTKTDTAIDLLDYTAYNAGGVSVDLSKNQATGVYGGLTGGLISGDGSIATTTTDSSFENVDGSRFNDSIIGDDQTNVLRGFDGADTIKGLVGNDTIDGGNGVGSNSTDGADTIEGGDGADTIIASFGNDSISGGTLAASDNLIDTLTYSATSISSARIEGLDISLTGTDKGTVDGDANSSVTPATFTNTYNSSINQQLITAPTNQVSKDWTQTYTDIQNLVLSEQSDILRIDSTDVSTGSIDARGGSLDTLDYSSFGAASPVLVNLSGAAYSFDFDNNGKIDTTIGEITITNANSATNVMVTAASSQGGANGVSGFEVVIGGAADDAIVGNASDNLLVGNAGDDRLDGGAGNDTIYGGTGDDYIKPGDGSDYVVAGAGINTIAITSSDLAQDTFNVDPNGINIFALQGNGTNVSSITAPNGSWDPGSQGIDLLDGGDPVVSGSATIYDTINGTSSADTYQFGGVAFKNIGNVDLGAGNDSVGTAATTKGIKVNYNGGDNTDSITLNLTFGQFAKLNASGLYVADVQNYLDSASGKTFSSSQADFTANNFETGGVAVVTPGVYNALQGDPAATTFNSAYGVRSSTISSGDDVNLSATALTTSTATALSVPDIVSAFVQASGVKGSDAITVSSGGSTTGSTTASQDASAVSRTVDDRADSVLSAYGLGTDRSSFTAGDDITLTLSGNVKADTTAESLGFVVNASGTVEAAGSRDSSLTAGDAFNLSINGTAAQTVGATNVAGLAIAGLANRTYGIDDANLTDTTTDSVQAGSDLSLQATASSSNRVTAQTVGTESLGTFTLVNNGTAATDRLTTTQIGADFPLINGDRVRFTSSNGSVQADRDYYVANVIPVTGEFQLSSEPNGDPIDVVAAGSLQAYRPAVATADAISTVTGVDLNRTSSGVQAGESLSLRASAADAITASATSVAGDATAGVFRLGGMDGLNLAAEVSSIQALADTASLAGNGASLSLTATDTATLMATSADGAALTEANIQVFGAKNSASTAGDDLNLSTQAALTLSGSASSTAGSAEARSGAGAGAGVATAGVTNVLPTNTSYSVVTGLADGTQTAGADLAVEAKAATALNATASTVSGAETLSSLWTSATGNILATFDLNLNTTTSTPSFVGPQYLAAGQLVQLDTTSATAAGLAADTDYAVKLLGFGAVDASNTGSTPNSITMPTGITYAVNDAVRFRLNSSTAPNSSDSRYGLALGTTYYVKSVSGNTFTLSTSTGGPVIDLSADSEGPADQLVDADRFQLLTLPTAPGGSYAVAALTPGVAGATPAVSLTLPAVANAFAGSREADRTLNNSDSLNLAQVSGISGNAGLRGLIAGAQNAITAMATGVLNAVARNTANDATASAGLVAEGLSDTAITAGSAGTVKADATISALADAATTGNNALIDTALADLTVTARGLTASNTANDISIGGVGDVQATASLAGRSSASTVLGDSDALAALKATGLEALSAGFTATIGQQGDFSAAAVIGTAAAPLLVESISAASGDATVQAASTAIGILGSYTAPGFSSLQAGAAQGDISGSASADLNLRAIAVDGAASVSLGTADIFGIKDMALTTGADLSQVNATAVGQATLLAQTVELDATSAGSTSVRGLFSSAAAALPVSFSEDGRIGAIAQQSSFAQSISVNGNASSTLSNDSLGIGNAAIAIDGVGALDASAISHLDNRAQSVTGAASA